MGLQHMPLHLVKERLPPHLIHLVLEVREHRHNDG
jgi:hypothetical protein